MTPKEFGGKEQRDLRTPKWVQQVYMIEVEPFQGSGWWFTAQPSNFIGGDQHSIPLGLLGRQLDSESIG